MPYRSLVCFPNAHHTEELVPPYDGSLGMKLYSRSHGWSLLLPTVPMALTVTSVMSGKYRESCMTVQRYLVPVGNQCVPSARLKTIINRMRQ